MWTNINNLDIVAGIKSGSRITKNPDRLNGTCIVKSATSYCIKAFRAGSNRSVLIFPQSKVISGKWWVEGSLSWLI
jgi:hypothetical protein